VGAALSTPAAPRDLLVRLVESDGNSLIEWKLFQGLAVEMDHCIARRRK
jgi:hypothetical protein